MMKRKLFLFVLLFSLFLFAKNFFDDNALINIIDKEIEANKTVHASEIERFCDDNNIDGHTRRYLVCKNYFYNEPEHFCVDSLAELIESVDKADLSLNVKLHELLSEYYYRKGMYEDASHELRHALDGCDAKVTQREHEMSLLSNVFVFCFLLLLIALLYYIGECRKSKKLASVFEHRLNVMLEQKAYMDEEFSKYCSKMEEANVGGDKQSTYDTNQSSFVEYAHKYVNNDFAVAIALVCSSAVYEKLIKVSRDCKMSMMQEDWVEFEKEFTNNIPSLMSILIQNAKVTQTERRVCLLVLLGWGTLEISNVLGLKQSSVSSAKKELYRKITGADGSARLLKDEIVKRIYASER